MTEKVILMKGAYNYCKGSWHEFAEKNNVELVHFSGDSREEFYDLFKNNDVIGLAHTYFGALDLKGWDAEEFRKRASSLKAVCHMGAGYELLPDVQVLKEMGITAANSPNGVQESTANTALYLALGAIRNFNAFNSSLRRGEWTGSVPLAHEPEGKTLGVIGLGGIGALARDKMVSALNLGAVQYYNRRRASADVEKGAKFVDFDTLLQTSDIIFLSVPLNKSTYHLLDAAAFSKMKDGVVIVNTARGKVIDEQALVDAIASGKVRSAGLDVFENEPKVHPDLIKNDNVLLLPHAGTNTIDARIKVEMEVIGNLDSFLSRGRLLTPIPEHQ